MKKKMFLVVIWSISFILCLFSLVGNTALFNSDLAYYLVAGHDIFDGNINLSGWVLGTNTFYVLHLFYGLLGKVFGYNPETIYIGSSILFATMASIICFLVIDINQILGKKECRKKVFVGIVFIFSSIWFNTTMSLDGGTHFDCAIIAIMTFYLVSVNYKKQEFDFKKYSVLYLLLFIMVCSDFLTIYFVFFPMLIVLFANFCKNSCNYMQKRYLLINFGGIIFITILSKFFLKMIELTGGFTVPKVANSLQITINDMWERLEHFGWLLLKSFGADITEVPIGTVGIKSFMCFLALAVFLFLLIFDFKNLIKDLFVQFLIASILITAGVLLFTNYISIEVGDFNTRLLYIVIGGFILLFTMVDLKRVLGRLDWNQKIIEACIASVLLLCMVSTLMEVKGDMVVESEGDRIVEVLKEKNLKKGYGTYWVSHNITIASEFECEVAPVKGEKVSRMNWQDYSTADWEYANFIILSKVRDNMQCTEEGLVKSIGKPNEIVDTEDCKIYIWDENIIPYIDGIGRIRKMKATSLSYTKNAIIENGNVILPEGEMLYGPYSFLSEGKYQVTFTGKNLKNVRADVFSNSYINSLGEALKYELTSKTEEKIVIKFVLPMSLSDIETRLENSSEDSVLCDSVIIERMD